MTELRSRPSFVMVRIEPRPDGTFLPSEAGQWAVTVGVDDSNERLCDFCAWFLDDEWHWWLRRGDQCHVLGVQELAFAADCHKTIKLVSTPEAWVRSRGRGVCLLKWDLDLAPLFEGVERVECDSPNLELQFREMLRRWEPQVITRQPVLHQVSHAA